MTATQELTKYNHDLELQLDIAQIAFKCLKTPALRRTVKELTAQLNDTKAPTAFAHVNSNRRPQRRRGVKLAQLIS